MYKMRNDKPNILRMVESQTKKSYGVRGEGRSNISKHTVDPLKNVPVFENMALCQACGKERHVNSSGFCESCWETFAHLRGEKIKNENNKP